MSEKLPKPMLDALAREAKPLDHPSADVLGAFVERALAEAERQSVTNHLVRCGECREVVFIASGAAEETSAEQQAAAAPAKARWRWNLAWAAPAAAVLLLAGGYFVWHGTAKIASGPELAAKRAAEIPVQTPEPSQKLAVEQPSAADAAPMPQAKPRVAAPPPNTLPANEARPASTGIAATNNATAAESKNLGATAEMAAPPQRAPAMAIGAPVAGMAPAPKANGFAPSAGESEALRQFSAADSLGASVNRAVAGVARTAHPGWRITPQGQIEHLTSEGWTRAFPEPRRVFRAVAVIGNQVWAGGDGGVLFHSGDGGQQWTETSLANGDGAETAAIVSIRFDDPQHGEVVTNSGSSYGTTDGGAIWTKR
jgi:Photosynthesis system II assembly factor YCF48